MRLRERLLTTRAVLDLAQDVASIYARAALSACLGRGYVGLQGLVYGATAPSSDRGFIKIDILDVEIPPTVRALAGAQVVIAPWRPEELSQQVADAQAAVRVVTQKDGHFMASRVLSSRRRQDFTVTVTAPGFEALECTFRQQKVMHPAVVVMVPSARHS